MPNQSHARMMGFHVLSQAEGLRCTEAAESTCSTGLIVQPF